MTKRRPDSRFQLSNRNYNEWNHTLRSGKMFPRFPNYGNVSLSRENLSVPQACTETSNRNAWRLGLNPPPCRRKKSEGHRYSSAFSFDADFESAQ